MAGKKKNSEKGAVLIMVLFILAGMALVSVDMNRNVLLDHAFSLSTRSSLAAKPVLASGENLAALFLVRDFQTETYQEGQESLPAMRRRFREWLAPYVKQLKTCDLEITIEDENSRFPLRGLFPVYNSDKARALAYAEMLERILAALLVRHGYDNGEDNARLSARRYVEALLAWGGQGILSDESVKWYLQQDPVYFPPQRPPESLGELLLVYWPDVDSEIARKTLLGEPGNPGLLENCSLWSRGPINMVTMSTVVGWGLAPDYQRALNFMEDLEAARIAQGDTLQTGWHQAVFANHAIQEPPSSVVSSRSRWFRIRTEARLGASRSMGEAVGWLTKTQMNWVTRAVL